MDWGPSNPDLWHVITKIYWVPVWVQLVICAMFEDIPSSHSLDIIFTRMGWTENIMPPVMAVISIFQNLFVFVFFKILNHRRPLIYSDECAQKLWLIALEVFEMNCWTDEKETAKLGGPISRWSKAQVESARHSGFNLVYPNPHFAVLHQGYRGILDVVPSHCSKKRDATFAPSSGIGVNGTNMSFE